MNDLDDLDGPMQEFIRLDQFLKWQNLTETGGHAKVEVQAGRVQVNGETETRRGRKLRNGDVVGYKGKTYTVDLD